MRRVSWALVVGLVGALCGAAALDVRADDGVDRPGVERAGMGGPLERRYIVLMRRLGEAFEEGDYELGLELAERAVEMKPFDPVTHYNLACALARNGRIEEGASSLEKAVELGFIDLWTLVRDPDAAALRETDVYQRIVGGWGRVLDARAEAEIASFSEAFGERAYSYDEDAALRLKRVSAYPEDETAAAWAEVELVAGFARGVFPEMFGAEEGRPDAWVVLALPTPEDFAVITGYPANAGVGGLYDKLKQRLVSRDIGPSLRHEFFHVLHWRHMDRLGQRHPLWIQEGLASFVEDVEVVSAEEGEGGEDGVVRVRALPNWRTNLVKRLAERHMLTKWERLLRLEDRRFMSQRKQAHYAESRAIIMFMHERGVLGEWYARYVETFGADPSGVEAMEEVFGEPLAEIERAFRSWALGLERVSEVGDASGGSLGVPLGPGEGDGPEVEGLTGPVGVEGRGDDRENRIKLGDVILSIDGERTPTLDALYRVLGEREPDEVVAVEVRRGTLRRVVRVRLVEPGSFE